MDNFDFISALRSILISVLSAAVLGVLLSAASAAAALGSDDPDSLIAPLSLASLGISALVCGASSARLSDGELPWALAGILSGSLFGILLFAVSFVPVSSGSDFIGGKRLVFTFLVILCSFIGAVVGRKRGKKRTSYVKRLGKKRR